MIYEQEGLSISSHDLTGKLEDFPIEIVWRMVYNAIQQGNTKKKALKELSSCVTIDSKWGGFTWSESVEGSNFWAKVLDTQDFSEFFKRYSTCCGRYSCEPGDIFEFNSKELMPIGLVNLILERSRTKTCKQMFTHSIMSLFTWSDTKEGIEFWNKIHKGNYSDYNSGIKNNSINTDNYETKLQNETSSVSRGAEIKGRRICGKESIAPITSRPLSYRGIIGK